MSGLKILPEAVAADPARFRYLFGLEPAPAAKAETPAGDSRPASMLQPVDTEMLGVDETPPAEDVAAAISDGQAQAGRGETEDRGSFAEHAGDVAEGAAPAAVTPDAADAALPAGEGTAAVPGYLAPPAGYQLRQGTIPAQDA